MILVLLFLMVISVLVFVWLKRRDTEKEVFKNNTWPILGIILTALIISPLSVTIGSALGRGDALRYKEFWNGFEVEAFQYTKQCIKDGGCTNTYSCDAETVTKTRGDETYTETVWHECPYATHEYTYMIKSTIEDHTVARGILAAEPKRWRESKEIPASLPRGDPAAWVEAKARIAAGEPRGVTVLKNYDNYLLASKSTILKEFSSDIETYKDQGLLPIPAKEVSALQAVKAYGVNYELNPSWASSVMAFNGAFGTELQGDLHIVIAKGISDPDNYTGALNAYWQSKELGRHALSKNALVVILGSENGSDISWVRAFTGLPQGNEQLLAQIRSDLKGVALEPRTVLGAPRAVLKDNELAEIIHTDGVLEAAVWGPNQFDRSCMLCKDAEDTGSGFSYLSGEIQPTLMSKLLTALIAPVFIGAGWFLILYLALTYPNPLGRFKITR